MIEQQALSLAEAFGGQAWQSGGGIWLVLRKRADGGTVVISEECACEYRDTAAFDRSEPSASVLLV